MAGQTAASRALHNAYVRCAVGVRRHQCLSYARRLGLRSGCVEGSRCEARPLLRGVPPLSRLRRSLKGWCGRSALALFKGWGAKGRGAACSLTPGPPGGKHWPGLARRQGGVRPRQKPVC